jgi:prepilin-type N-terminal cleavage/methylation domain-containing protein
MGTRNTNRIRQAKGFTIVELMVVIGLILALSAIGLTTMNLMLRRASAERTRSTMHMAKGLSTEYRAQFGTAVNHFGFTPINWAGSKLKNAPGSSGGGTPNDPIEKFVWAVWQVEELRDRLRSKAIDDIVIDSDGDGFLELVDGWNNQITYAAFVYRNDLYAGDDFFPTITTPIFMSRGPNEEWGTFVNNNKPDANAEDNIRSDEL